MLLLRRSLIALALLALATPLSARSRDYPRIAAGDNINDKAKDAAQDNDKLTLVNGDTISGTLLRADSKNVVFKSTLLGELTLPWKNIKSLTTGKPYTVVTKENQARVGPIDADLETIRVIPPTANAATPASTSDAGIPINDTVMVLDPQTYEKKVAVHPAPWQGWTGSMKGGVNLIDATQSQQVYTAEITFVRTTPELSWLPPHDKTTLSFLDNYGKLTQPGAPEVRTSIFHAIAEQDEFLSQRLFAYISAVYDHNIAQSLSLQQAYGGGIGWKIFDHPQSQVEAKGDLHYTRQSFEFPETQNNLLASSFSLTGMHKLPRAMLLRGATSFSPAYNRTNAFQMSGSSSLSVPLYHALSLDISFVDNYLNNPQPGFKQNSLQFTSGFQFNIK